MRRTIRKAILAVLQVTPLALLSVSLPALAQVSEQGPEAGKTYRIGIITYAGTGMEVPIKRALADLGYVEGENTIYEFRAGNRNLAVMDGLASELVAWKPDLIISLMTNAHVAVKNATADNPIPVVLWSADPLGTGVIESFRRPGTNFTGFSYEPHLQVLQVRFLKLTIPDIRCIGHLYNHTYAPAPAAKRELEAAGALMNVPVRIYEVLEKGKLEPALAQMKADGCAGFVVGPHELFNGNGVMIGELALKYGLVAVSIQTTVTDGGGVAAFSPPFERGWPAMALVIDRLLRGANPADIPIERGFKSPLTVNLEAVRRLGLELPAQLVEEADRVIE